MKRKILVTGAGGFLGGWVVEICHLTGIEVRAGVRRWNGAMRIARFPVEIVACDVMDSEQLDASLHEVDSVVHCAVGGDEVTIDGTRNVLAAAARHHLRRVVHISTAAVYGNSTGSVTEQSPLKGDGNPYAARKIEAERICMEYVEKGLPVVILRPSIIYGPFGASWTIDIAQRLQSGAWGTFGQDGEGLCNLVYATDVVSAILKALENERASGEAFNIGGGEVVTWNQYFEKFNEHLGRGRLPELNMRKVRITAAAMQPVRVLGQYLLSRHRSTISKLYKSNAIAGGVMKATESKLKVTPRPQQLRLFRAKAIYPIDKARDQLSYVPQVDLEQGLDLSKKWLEHHGFLR